MRKFEFIFGIILREIIVVRLKNIRSMVTPELLFALAKAGDGDTIVIAANGFPANRY